MNLKGLNCPECGKAAMVHSDDGIHYRCVACGSLYTREEFEKALNRGTTHYGINSVSTHTFRKRMA